MNQLFKRLGALLLALAMVVGMLPVGVFAAEDTLLELEVWLEMTDCAEASAQNAYNGGYSSGYLYEVKFTNNPTSDQDVKYYWDFDYNTTEPNPFTDRIPGTGDNDYSVGYYLADNDDHAVAVKVVVDGLSQIVAFVGSDISVDGKPYTVRSDKEKWAMKSLPIVKLGEPFALEDGIPMVGSGIEGGTVVFEDTIVNTDMVERLPDGRYIITDVSLADGTAKHLFNRNIYAGMPDTEGGNPALRQVEKVSAQIDYPTYLFTVEGKEPGEYWGTETYTEVTVRVISDEAELQLPDLKVDDVQQQTSWNYQNGVWETKAAVNPNFKITMGKQDFIYKVDNTDVTITNAIGRAEGEKTVITFDAQIGVSGIKSVTLNGQAVTCENVGGNSYKITVEGILTGENTLTVTNKAGASKNANVPMVDDLSIVVDESPETVNGYVQAHKDYTVTITGLTDGVTLSSLTLGGEAITCTNGTAVFSSSKLESTAKTLKAVDSLGRTAEREFGQITVDNILPTVSVTAPSGYQKTAQTVSFQINEEGVGIADGAYVSYVLKGDGNVQTVSFDASGKAQFTVSDGQELVSYTICGVKDKVGNSYTNNDVQVTNKLVVDGTPPEVKVEFSSNVKGVKVYNNQIFLMLSPVEDLYAGDDETVSVKFTVTDPNLSADATSMEYFCSADVPKHETAYIAYIFPAKDLAENAASKVTLKVALGDGTEMTTEIDGSDGIFDGLLAVDRRMPSEDKNAAIPNITAKPVNEPTTKVPHKKATTEVPLYAVNTFEFNATISDGSKGGKDSGLAIADITVEGDGLDVNHTVSGDQYAITVTAEEGKETDAGALHIKVMDNVGNGFTFTRYFCVDNKDPEIDMPIPEPSGKDENGVYYYKNNQTIAANVSDLFLEKITLNGEETDKPEYLVSTDAKVDAIEVSALDKAGHSVTVTNDKKLVIDGRAPHMNLEITGLPDNHPDHFAKGALNYRFVLQDAYLDKSTVTLKYEILEHGERRSTEVGIGAFKQNASDPTEYTYDFVVNNGQKVVSYEFKAADYAGNPASRTMKPEESILVDTIAPVVTVSSTSEDTEWITSGKADYFQSDVTYTFKVEDENITKDSLQNAVKLTVKNADSADMQEIVLKDWAALEDDKAGWQASFVLQDGRMLTAMTVTVADAAGNIPASVGGNVTWDYRDGTFAYTGNKVVVDSTAPEATLTFAMDESVRYVTLDGFGYNTKTGMNYAKLNIASNVTEEELKNTSVKIIATMTVKDANLYEDGLKPEKNGEWIFAGFEENDNGNKAVYTKSVEVSRDDTGDFLLELYVSDLAGNKMIAEDVDIIVGESNNPPIIKEGCEDGKLVIDMIVDYRQPNTQEDEETPRILVSYNPSSTGKKQISDDSIIDLFKEAPEISAVITDTKKGTDENRHSGLAKVTYSLTDSQKTVTSAVGTVTVEEDGYARFRHQVEAAAGESNDVKLEIVAADYAGNAIRYLKHFGVDTLAPRIKGAYGEEKPNEVNGVSYFKEDRQLTLTLTDINTDLTKTTVTTTGTTDNTTDTTTGTKDGWTINGSESTKVVDFTSGEHTFAIVSTDLAGNTNENKVDYNTNSAPTAFTIDKAAPVVEITRNFSGKQFTDGATDYLDQDVTYNFKVTDQYLDSTGLNGQAVEIRYTVNGKDTAVVLGSNEGPVPNYQEVDGKDVYTHSFTLHDGDVLSALTVKAVDNAKNVSEVNMVDGVKDPNGNDVFYKDHTTVVVDKTAPVVKMVRTGGAEKNQTANGYDFYSNDVTYTFTVTDTNLNGSSSGFVNKANYTISVNGVAAESNTFAWSNDGSRMTAAFTVTDGQMLKGFELQIKDAAGNPAKLEEVVTDASHGDADAFKVENAEEGKFSYAGKPVVVDTTAPTARLTVVSDPADQLVNYFTDAMGVCYVKLKNPTDNATGEKEVTVKLRLEVTDRNLSVIPEHTSGLIDNKDKTNKAWAAGSGSWSADYLVNNDGTAVYTRSVTVKTNQNGQIAIDLNVEDLAGNKINPVIEMEKINGTTPSNNPLKADGGNVAGIITLDRRQPTTGNDTDAPYIKLIPSITNVAKTRDGVNLYNSGLKYELIVSDGAKDGLNAGLKPFNDDGMGNVTWKLTYDHNYDGSFVGSTSVVDEESLNDNYNHRETIIVAAGNGECNHFELTVTAVDNVGNTIVYTEVFAIDSLAPRVTVSYDNNSVLNEKYFKEDRIATVTVEDINFSSATTDIDTEVTPGGWQQRGDRTYVSTSVYNVDNDYTFKMSSTDIAKNTTSNEGVKYEGVATEAFTIDKTAPVIELSYSPDDMQKQDAEQVVYYAEDQTVSVIVNEHNFRANDVVADFYINRDNPLDMVLGNFAANGNEYTAQAIYDQGNRYRLKVSYSDLAGNLAEPVESHIFTVDKEAPAVTITTPNMKAGELNMVTDELELGFEIKDEQDNLKKYQVVITHLNNAFNSYVFDTIEDDNLSGDGRKTITISLEDIEHIKVNDGLYTVQVIGWDYAENQIELVPELVFSLNRFGSTFTTQDPFTKQFLTPGSDGVVYHSGVDGNLIFQEINPNRVFSDETMQDEGSSLTIIVNGRSVRLNKGTDYTVKVEQQGEGEYQWYVYTYEIDQSVFLSDGELLNGRYSILIYGVDEAANDNTNEGNEAGTVQQGSDGAYSGKIEFVLDNKAPVIITTGIEAGEVYDEEYRRMEIEISDSTPTEIQVYLNNELVALTADAAGNSNDQPWLALDEATGIYTLNVNEQNGIFASQTVRIEVKDAAGNTEAAEIAEFHVSTSWLVSMINSVWFYVALSGVGAAGVFVALRIRKKKIV